MTLRFKWHSKLNLQVQLLYVARSAPSYSHPRFILLSIYILSCISEFRSCFPITYHLQPNMLSYRQKLSLAILTMTSLTNALVSFHSFSTTSPLTHPEHNPLPRPTLQSLLLPLRRRSILLCRKLNANTNLRFLPKQLHHNLSMRNKHLSQRSLRWSSPPVHRR
jgi:hypothetical protein